MQVLEAGGSSEGWAAGEGADHAISSGTETRQLWERSSLVIVWVWNAYEGTMDSPRYDRLSSRVLAASSTVLLASSILVFYN